MFVSIDLLTLEPNKFNVTVLYKCASCVSPDKIVFLIKFLVERAK